MEIRQVSDSVAIYSDGQRLQVIHDLGDEFILDIGVSVDKTYNIDTLLDTNVTEIVPVFKVSGYCSRSGEDMHRLRWAICQFGIFEEYLRDNQDDLSDWYKKIKVGEEE